MNIYQITDVNEVVKLNISTQEKIRLLFRLGMTRSEISKKLSVKYQIVFKACNPKYAPKQWVKVLTHRMSQEKSKKTADIPEVPLHTN